MSDAERVKQLELLLYKLVDMLDRVDNDWNYSKEQFRVDLKEMREVLRSRI